MGSVFDDAFSDAADTFHDVFGVGARYTIAATETDVDVQIIVEHHDVIVEQRADTRSRVWVLIGTITKALIPAPAVGDSLILDDDEADRIYKLKGTPTESQDGLQWQVEFRHEQPVTRGGQKVFPVI